MSPTSLTRTLENMIELMIYGNDDDETTPQDMVNAHADDETMPQDMIELIIELMVNANDDDEYAQAFIAFDKLLYWGALDYEVERSICPELLRRMHSDQDNQKLQERIENILRDLDKRCHTVIRAVHSFVEAHPDDAYVACLRCRLIMNERFFDHADYHSIHVVVTSMIRHENDPVVQVYSIDCIEYFMGESYMNDEVQETGALHACLQAMRNYPDDSVVQVAACRALSLFKYELIIKQEWPPAMILQTLNNHVHSEEVQVSAFDCLGRLLEIGRDYIETILESFFLAGRDYLEVFLQALQTHPTNEKVQGAALRVLARMTDDSASLNRIIQGGGVDLVVRAMRIEKGTACLRAIYILKNFFGFSTDARRKAIELGAIPMLLDILRQDNGLEWECEGDWGRNYDKKKYQGAALCAPH